MITDLKIKPFLQFKTENIKPQLKKIGWLCTYTPEEIIIASGFTPVRIIGKNKSKKAEGYCPINFCPYIKSSLEDIFNLSLSLDICGLIFTNSCDATRRLYDLTKIYIDNIPSFMLDVPRNKNEIALKHYENNILKLINFLESLNQKKITVTDLENSIILCNEKRVLLKKLNNYFKNIQYKIGIKNYFQILECALIDEPINFINNLKKYLDYINNETINTESNLKNSYNLKNVNKNKVMIIGNYINEEKLWEIFDEIDCIIASDDICNSSRYFENITEQKAVENLVNNTFLKNYTNDYFQTSLNSLSNQKNEDLLKIIRDISLRYLYKPQCARMSNLDIKINEIKRNIQKNNINGVIFISQKFCDNTLLFYPLLRQELNIMKIPSLFLEIEHNNISTGQIKTRIQAFLEIIKNSS